MSTNTPKDRMSDWTLAKRGQNPPVSQIVNRPPPPPPFPKPKTDSSAGAASTAPTSSQTKR